MRLQPLSSTMAFSSGSDLWILPSPDVCFWARKIDWYLNFQLARAENHRPPQWTPGLIEILKEEGLEPPSTESWGEAPLLIASRHRLPTSQAVELPYNGRIKDWMEAAEKIWRDLGRPSLRLFLPQNVQINQAEAHWHDGKTGNRPITVVSEAGST